MIERHLTKPLSFWRIDLVWQTFSSSAQHVTPLGRRPSSPSKRTSDSCLNRRASHIRHAHVTTVRRNAIARCRGCRCRQCVAIRLFGFERSCRRARSTSRSLLVHEPIEARPVCATPVSYLADSRGKESLTSEVSVECEARPSPGAVRPQTADKQSARGIQSAIHNELAARTRETQRRSRSRQHRSPRTSPSYQSEAAPCLGQSIVTR